MNRFLVSNPIMKRKSSGSDSFLTSTPGKPGQKKARNMTGDIGDLADVEDDNGIDIQRLVEEIEVKASQKRGKGTGSRDNGDEFQAKMDLAVEKAISKLLPVLVTAISNRLEERAEKRMEKLESHIKILRSEIDQEKARNLIRDDKNEQFVRKDCFVVEGVKEVPEGRESAETLVTAIAKLGDAIQVPVVKESIGDIHRIGRRGGARPRPIVVKTNRLLKSAIMTNKKKLRENGKIKADNTFGDRVSVYDDMTMPRRKLMKDIKEMANVEFCYSRDGTIICKLNDGTFKHVNSADDLFLLGVEEVDYGKYYNGLMENGS